MKNKTLPLIFLAVMIISIMQVSALTQIKGTYLENGLVHFYSMNETAGSTVKDNYDGSDLSNTNANVGNSTALLQTSYYFDGSSSYLHDFAANTFNSSGFSISVWVYNPNSNNGYFLGGISSGVSGFALEYGVATASKFAAEFQGATPLYSTSTYTWTSGWHSVIFTYDGSTGTIYLDGSNIGSGTKSISASALNYFIGAINNVGSPANYFKGNMQLMGIWNYALNSTAISDLYNSGNGLVYYNSSSGGGNTPSSSINVTLISPANNTVTTSLSNSFTAGVLSNQSLTNATISIFYANGTLLYSNIIYNTSLAMQNIWVADKGNEKMQKWSTALNNQVTYNLNEYSSLPAGNYKVALDKYSNLWVASDANISRINPNGTITSFSGGGGTAIAYDGMNMWTVFNQGSPANICYMNKIDPNGAVTTYTLDTIGCVGIAFDGTNLWTTGIQNGGNYNFTATKVTTSGTFIDYISTIGFAFAQANPLVFDGTYIWNFATKISTSGVITGGQNQISCNSVTNTLTGVTFDGTNIWGIAGSNGCGTLLERINQNQTVSQFTISEFNSNGGGGIFYDKTLNKLYASKDDEQTSCSPNCFLDTWAEINIDGTLNSSMAITSSVHKYTDILVNYDPLYLINKSWSYTFASNGNYTWNVKAYDALGGSGISLNNTIIVNFTAPIFNITGTVPDLNMSFNQVKSVIFDNQHYFQGATSYILTVINPDTNQSINISASNPSLLTSKYLVQILIGNNNVTTFQFTSYSSNYSGQIIPYGCNNNNVCVNGTVFYLRISEVIAPSTNFADTGSNYLLGILPPASTLNFTQKLSYSGIIIFLLDIALLIAAALAGMMGGDSAKAVLAVIGIIDAAVIIGLIAIDYIPFILVVGIIIIILAIIGLIKRRG